MSFQRKLVFDGAAVLELLAHAKAAPEHTSPYGLTPNPGPGLMLVKDDGIYLMSNGEPGLAGAQTINKIVYPRGYEALPSTAAVEERSERYDKIRAAAGGDDFPEFLPAKSFDMLLPQGTVEIQLLANRLRLSVAAPAKNSIKKLD